MKKYISYILVILLIVTMLPVTALATEAQEFLFELSVDGSDTKTVNTGDIITVVLRLKRTDASDPYTMYAMQDEIRYDSSFFELVEGSAVLSDGITSTDIGMRDEYREFYMNFLSTSGGTQWNQEMLIGSFQLKVIATTGVTKISNQDYLVSTKDGQGSYPCNANELTIILSTECTVHFESNGGSLVADQSVQYGEKIVKPEDPIREGYQFDGWYKDIDKTEIWDFDNDTVSGNVTLFAKWIEGSGVVPGDNIGLAEDKGCCWIWIVLAILILILLLILLLSRKTVTFNSMGGSDVKSMKVRKGQKVKRPNAPAKLGCKFMGWYKDPRCIEPWNFEKDTVSENRTLYAKWSS